MALRNCFEPGRTGLAIPAHPSRAVDADREQDSYRELPEDWIAVQSLDRISRGIQILDIPSERSTTAYFTRVVL